MPWQVVKIRKRCSLSTRSFLIPLTAVRLRKFTINNRRWNKADFEQTILIPMADDDLDKYRKIGMKIRNEASVVSSDILLSRQVHLFPVGKSLFRCRRFRK